MAALTLKIFFSSHVGLACHVQVILEWHIHIPSHHRVFQQTSVHIQGAVGSVWETARETQAESWILTFHCSRLWLRSLGLEEETSTIWMLHQPTAVTSLRDKQWSRNAVSRQSHFWSLQFRTSWPMPNVILSLSNWTDRFTPYSLSGSVGFMTPFYNLGSGVQSTKIHVYLDWS